MIRKIFRPAKYTPWKILEKEAVDEIIFKEPNARNRVLLELMARGGVRVGEALKLTPRYVEEQ